MVGFFKLSDVFSNFWCIVSSTSSSSHKELLHCRGISEHLHESIAPQFLRPFFTALVLSHQRQGVQCCTPLVLSQSCQCPARSHRMPCASHSVDMPRQGLQGGDEGRFSIPGPAAVFHQTGVHLGTSLGVSWGALLGGLCFSPSSSSPLPCSSTSWHPAHCCSQGRGR